MSWEARNGKDSYFYLTTRRNGRFVRTYHGNGPEAQRIAAEVQARRDERQSQQQQWREQLAAWAQLDAPTEASISVSTLIMELMNYAAGLHSHRSTWRLRKACLKGAATTPI